MARSFSDGPSKSLSIRAGPGEPGPAGIPRPSPIIRMPSLKAFQKLPVTEDTPTRLR